MIDALSFKLGISPSAIKMRVPFIIEIVEKHGGQLLSVSNEGLSLTIDNQFVNNFILYVNDHFDYSTSTNMRFIYIVDTLLTFPTPYTIELFAEELNVGKHTIRKDLKSVENWLKKYKLIMNKTPSLGLTIEGEEQNKRVVLLKMNRRLALQKIAPKHSDPLEVYDIRLSDQNIFALSQIIKITEIGHYITIIKDIEDELNQKFSDRSFYQLIEYLIMVQRRINMNNLIDSHQFKHIDEEIEFYKDVSAIALGNLLGTNTKDIDESYNGEIIYLALCLVILSPNHIASKILDICEHQPIAENFIKYLSEVVGVDMTDNLKLRNDISLFFRRTKIQSKYMIIKESSIKNVVKSNHSELLAVCISKKEELEELLGFVLYESDLSYLAILISNAIEHRAIYRGALITASDDNISEYVLKTLNKSLENLDLVDKIKMEDFNYELLDNYDLVLTDLNIKHPKIIGFNRSLNPEELLFINEKITTLLYDRSINENSIRFQEKLIEVDSIYKNKEHLFKEVTNKMIDEGIVSSEFYHEILKRDNIEDTVIGNGVAIPHVYETGVKKNAIYVVRLKRQMQWNSSERVDLVLLLAINSKNNNLLKDFFKGLYNILLNKSLLNKIREVKSSDEIYNLLKDVY